MDPSGAGKLLIIAGIIIAGVGAVVMLGAKLPGVGRLPGDFVIERNGITLFFPLASGLLLSLILTIVLNVIFRLFR